MDMFWILFSDQSNRGRREESKLKPGESLSDYNFLLTSTVAKLTKVRGGGGLD